MLALQDMRPPRAPGGKSHNADVGPSAREYEESRMTDSEAGREASPREAQPEVRLERVLSGPPLSRVTLSLESTGIYGTGPDETAAMEDLLDEIDIWSIHPEAPPAGVRGGQHAGQGEDGVAVLAARRAILGELQHLTRTQRRAWVGGLAEGPSGA